MEQLFIFKVNFIKKGCIFLVNFFPLYFRIKSKLFHNCTLKNLFPSACYWWDGTISLRDVDQKVLHGGNFGYGDSYLDSVFRYSKVLRLHAILHDAAGAVRLQTVKRLGFCFMIGQCPNCCVIGQVIGLLFCLYVKIFLPSIS